MAKMKRKSIQVWFAAILIAASIPLASPATASAAVVLIDDGADFIEQAKALNGQVVEFQGEVVGDIMQRQDHAWINVLCRGTAIGVWISEDQQAALGLAGRYGVTGDTVKIIGQFSQACPEHGGDLDVHAITLEIVAAGQVKPEPLSTVKLIVACGSFAAAAISLALLIRRRTRKRF
jgi:hypothetical protein